MVAGHDTDPEWAALDLCAQAEHGAESPLVVAAVEEAVLEAIEGAVAASRGRSAPSVADAPLALVQVPDLNDAIDLANAFAPEHLELIEEDAALLADRVTTAGCVFARPLRRHRLRRLRRRLQPRAADRRRRALLGAARSRRLSAAGSPTVEIPAEAAAKLAPHVDTLARAEGFPVHGESAMIRSETDE